jgi:hypothetical protein
MRLTISTSTQDYQRALALLDELAGRLSDALPVFASLPAAKQCCWLQRDPLLRRVLILSRRTHGLIVEEDLAW